MSQNNNIELWKDIKGYEGKYQISSFGNVKSLDYNHTGKEKILKLSKPNRTWLYYTIDFLENGKHKRFYVHRLVANAFIPNPSNKPQINHKDGNKLNNNMNNLEWCTQNENVIHAYDNNLIKSKRKSISQYDQNGKLIKKWKGIREIQRELGYSSGFICDCCKGKYRQGYGFIWKYTPEEE